MVEPSEASGRSRTLIAGITQLPFPITGLVAQAGVAEGGLSVPWSTVLLVVSVFGYALVNAVEIAVIGANRIRIRHLAEKGNRSAKALERIRAREDRFFASIVLLQNFSVVIASTMAGLLAVELAGGWGLIVGTIIVTAGIALFGEVAPKVLAARAADPLSLLLARPVELLTIALRPIAIVFAAAPNVISRVLFGQSAKVTPTVTEAELRMLIDIAATERAVGEEEAELIERVFHFYDRRVNEMMIPRTEVVALELGTTIEEFQRVFGETPHTRFPVYRESVDNVVGVVTIKDVLQAMPQGRATPETPIDRLMRPAYFVPETKLVGELFVEMQERRQHMTIIVDEYGGTAGIVTLELLLEEMVGRVADELGGAEEEFQTIDAHTVRVDGGLSIHEAREELDLDIPEGDYETVAGYVLTSLGHIPIEGEVVSGDGFRITVAEVKGRKIEQLVVTRLTTGGAAAAEQPAS
ncbi:MAG: hemolysin family protein [Conexibacter sp.]